MGERRGSQGRKMRDEGRLDWKEKKRIFRIQERKNKENNDVK